MIISVSLPATSLKLDCSRILRFVHNPFPHESRITKVLQHAFSFLDDSCPP